MLNYENAIQAQHEYDEYLMDCLDGNILPLNFVNWEEILEG